MHVLTVLSHPDPASLSRAVARRFIAGAEAAGHTAELADLHGEGFDPRWSLPDLAQFEDRPMPADILAEQARIERADAIALVFPLFWWDMPAMLKGWIDRVWSSGWAYDETTIPGGSLQRDRIGVMLVPAAVSPQSMAERGLEAAMETIWRTGTMGNLGMADLRIHILHGSTGSDERRKGILEQAHRAGLALGDGQSVPPPK